MKMIIVEDEQLILDGIVNTFQWEKIDIEIVGYFNNATQAYSAITQLEPDIVISDIVMPEHDGIWLLNNVKQFNETIEVILLTNHDDFEYAKSALKFGAADYVSKIDMYDILIDSVEKIIKKIRSKQIYKTTNRFSYPSLITIQNYYSKVPQNNIYNSFFIEISNFELKKGNQVFSSFSKHDNAFISFIWGSSPDLQDDIQDMQKNLKNQSSIIGISSIGHVESDLAKCYFEAFKAYDYAIMTKNNNSILTFDMISDDLKYTDINSLLKNTQSALIFNKNSILADTLEEFFSMCIKGRFIYVHSVHTLLAKLLDEIHFYFSNTKNQAVLDKYEKEISMTSSITSLSVSSVIHLTKMSDAINEYASSNDMNAIMNYIDKNYTSNINMKSVAAYFCMSPSYFSTKFKKHVGLNFTSYLKSKKLDLAIYYITKSEMNITRIANEVGYNDIKYFTDIFKKKYGVSPSVYRKIHYSKKNYSPLN